MHKTVVDKITLAVKPLREKQIPDNGIAHIESENLLEKDSSNRSILFGEFKAKFLMPDLCGCKYIGLNVDFRPMQDTMERLDMFVDIRLFRNGIKVDRHTVKHTFRGMLKANGKNIMEFVLTSKKLLNKQAVEAGDILTVTFRNSRPLKKTVYFANMYITKE